MSGYSFRFDVPFVFSVGQRPILDAGPIIFGGSPEDVTRLSLAASSTQVNFGDRIQLKIHAQFASGNSAAMDPSKVTLTNSLPQVVKIDADGTLTLSRPVGVEQSVYLAVYADGQLGSPARAANG